MWDASTGETLKMLEGHTQSVRSAAFSSNANRIVSASDDGSVWMWDASTGETLKVLEGHTNYVMSVAFSSDGNRIISGSDDKSVRVWDPSIGETLKVPEHSEPAAFSVNGKHAAADSNNKSMQVLAVPTQRTSLEYVRQKTMDSSGYHRHTGWLLSPQGEHYLMFVPLTAGLPDSSNILTLPQSSAASVDFTSSTFGSKWCNCFSS